ncbi:DUF3597 domain-containing protein [Bradyrhizobium genosp. P]|uniref:DUF3597 domain-containing protein n=1 Tax=Bradyrhizobium genosp. P TaxID=83641 RepID=UPI003CF9A47D
MSVFGSIMGAIFGHGSTQAKTPPTATTAAGASGASPTVSAPAAAPGSAASQTVDVAAIVDKAASATGERLEWRTSIVDLMKALGLDSSLAARKQLAKELNYSGDTDNSAAMNVWLHQQVMTKLAANGGKLPSDIKV